MYLETPKFFYRMIWNSFSNSLVTRMNNQNGNRLPHPVSKSRQPWTFVDFFSKGQNIPVDGAQGWGWVKNMLFVWKHQNIPIFSKASNIILLLAGRGSRRRGQYLPYPHPQFNNTFLFKVTPTCCKFNMKSDLATNQLCVIVKHKKQSECK